MQVSVFSSFRVFHSFSFSTARDLPEKEESEEQKFTELHSDEWGELSSRDDLMKKGIRVLCNHQYFWAREQTEKGKKKK